jgi:hypothetical protein
MSLNFADLSRAGARKAQSRIGSPVARALFRFTSHNEILSDPRRGFKGLAGLGQSHVIEENELQDEMISCEFFRQGRKRNGSAEPSQGRPVQGVRAG